MTTSNEIGELVGALASARTKFKAFTKDQTANISSTKGSYTYKYGDKASLFEAVMPSLNAEGLALIQSPHATETGRAVLVTLLAHKSGQWMRSEMPMHLYDRPQDTGSELTYLSRYAAQLMLGVASEADDDGAGAQQGTQRQQPATAAQAPSATPSARPSATPRAVPSAKPAGKQAFVESAMKLVEPPGLMDPPPFTADDVPF